LQTQPPLVHFPKRVSLRTALSVVEQFSAGQVMESSPRVGSQTPSPSQPRPVLAQFPLGQQSCAQVMKFSPLSHVPLLQ
jgi:hypothetical protein